MSKMGKNKRKPYNFMKPPNSHFEKRGGGGFKRSRSFNSSYEQNSGDPSAAETVYRLLCPARKIGGLIGKGGDIIKALRDESGAKIKVGETIPGTDERVVIIFSSSTKKPKTHNGNDNPEGPKDPENPEILENDDPIEKEQESKLPHCSAQDALLKVHERIVQDEDLCGGMATEDDTDNNIVTARLLVPNNQVGCLLGKGGHVIQKLRSETGADILVLPADHLPACAMATDELVQITATPAIAKQALYEVSTLLYKNPRPSMNYPVPAGGDGFPPPGPPMEHMPPGNGRWSHRNSGFRGRPPMPWTGGFGNEFQSFPPGGFSGPPAGNDRKASVEFSLKILCPTEKIGWVIGKGGSNVMQTQKETGANIRVEDAKPESDEHVILVSAFDASWYPRSPTIEAILQLQIIMNARESMITTRLLVPSSKVGCLLGQGGRIINEMRRQTQADIRIISDDGKPNFASPDEELVQICGNVDVARKALIEVSSRLRMRSLEVKNAGVETGPVGPFPGFRPPESFPPRGLPPRSMIGAGSSGGFEQAKGGGHRYEVPPAVSGYPNINSSMEVKIPNVAVNSVLGVGGSNISNIGQMSGAKVKLNDPSGGSECIVEIHGSSEQMNAAQNLLQSFISSAVQSFNVHQQVAPHGSSGVQNFNVHQQQPAPYAQNLHPQQRHSPYASVPNFNAAQQQQPQPQPQQSPYPSAASQSFYTQQQYSPYPSAQNFNAAQPQQQQYSPYPSAQNFNAAQPQQQQQNPYAPAATQNYDSQQQQHNPYAPAVQNIDPQQQQNPYAPAVQNLDLQQQQQNPYAPADSQQQSSYAAAAAVQNFNAQHQQYQQRPSQYAPAVQNYDMPQQQQAPFQY